MKLANYIMTYKLTMDIYILRIDAGKEWYFSQWHLLGSQQNNAEFSEFENIY